MESNLTYPYPELVHLLKIECEPEQYRSLGYSRKNKNGLNPTQDPEYLELIHKYIYARCPFCQTACVDKIDTYNLFRFGFLHNKLNLAGKYILTPDYPFSHNPPCEHFVGKSTFFNLHNFQPLELTEQIDHPLYFNYGIPHVTSSFLPDDIDSYCVIHAVPCCRIENNRFVPRYTFFILTYFSSQPNLVIKRINEIEFAKMQEDSEYYPCYVSIDNDLSLVEWAELGKLGFLNYENEDLPLLIGENLLLPDIYRNIERGIPKWKRVWRDGQFKKW